MTAVNLPHRNRLAALGIIFQYFIAKNPHPKTPHAAGHNALRKNICLVFSINIAAIPDLLLDIACYAQGRR
jgi:hypothetical protein